MRARYIIAGLCLLIVLGHLPAIIAEASAESCAAHLAKHGVSESVDIAEHKAGIQPGKSPCGTGDSNHGDDTRDDGKSRYCRRHWYC